MSTIRVKKDANYFAASNEPFNDERLSWEARGLMGYLLSKPNDWKVNQQDIINRSNAGERKVKRMLAELRAAGYMNRVRVTLEHNKFDWITEVYESPKQNPRPSKSFIKSQCDVLQSLDNPPTGKCSDIVSTEIPSTEVLKRDSEFQTIAHELATLQRGGLKPTDADLIQDWLKAHKTDRIIQAVQVASDNGAHSAKYVDSVLIGWEANGYPKPRSQRVNEAKTQSTAKQKKNGGDALERYIAEMEAAECQAG